MNEIFPCRLMRTNFTCVLHLRLSFHSIDPDFSKFTFVSIIDETQQKKVSFDTFSWSGNGGGATTMSAIDVDLRQQLYQF